MPQSAAWAALLCICLVAGCASPAPGKQGVDDGDNAGSDLPGGVDPGDTDTGAPGNDASGGDPGSPDDPADPGEGMGQDPGGPGDGGEPLPDPEVPTDPSGYGPPRAWADLASAAIRPGVQTVTGGGQCTSNFVFTSRDNSTVYIGQAAHCAKTSTSPQAIPGCEAGSEPLNTTVEVEGASLPGRMVYSSWLTMQEVGETDPNTCQYNDFALVELDPADFDKVNPAMLKFGGPTAIADPTQASMGDKVITYGNSGLRLGIEQLSPHEGYIVEGGSAGGWTSLVYTAPNGVPGDSGSGVLMSDGQGLGIMVTMSSFPPAANGVTSLSKAIEYANTMGGMDIQLATWELIDGGLLP